MTVGAKLRPLLKRGVERALRRYGLRLIKPANRFGIDAITDVARLAGHWNIDLSLIFDVGANVGRSALGFRPAWPACEVVAFEPNAAVARRLRVNVAAVGRVRVEQVALGARGGRSDLFIYGDASDLSSLNERTPYTERFGLRGEAVSVPVTTLDAFCRGQAIDRINLLKIDAEGSDHDILLGDRRIDFVYCEFNSLDPDPDRLGSLLPIATLLGGHAYNFVASYNDYIRADGRFFSVSNALFAADRSRP